MPPFDVVAGTEASQHRNRPLCGAVQNAQRFGEGGAALRIVFVLAAMPPAFYSLIPPQLYGLDTDLANYCWLFNSGDFLALIPLLFIGQGLL